MNIIEKYSAYNHYDYNNPKYIIVHYVGAQGSTAKNNAIYFCGGDRQASAHEFIDDNDCYKVIRENQGAWHIGNTRTAANNQNSIGIEMCCMAPTLGVTEKTEANTIERVLYYMKKYNIPLSNVMTHYEATQGNKICPNWQANNWQRWHNFKAKLEKALKGNTTINISTKTQNNTTINIPVSGLGYLNLKPHMQSWRVYAVDGPYTTNYAVGALAPAQFGGLSYEILEKKATDVYKIKTSSFGVVAIYAPRDNDSSITAAPVY